MTGEGRRVDESGAPLRWRHSLEEVGRRQERREELFLEPRGSVPGEGNEDWIPWGSLGWNQGQRDRFRLIWWTGVFPVPGIVQARAL